MIRIFKNNSGKEIFSICFLLFIFSCSSPGTRFNENIKAGKCEEATLNLSKEGGKKASFWSEGKRVIGSLFSYSATGLGHATDVGVWLTKELGIRVVICSPVALVALKSGEAGKGFSQCVTSVSTSFEGGKTNFGKKIYNGTETWRCSDLSQLSKKIRSIASCYQERGTPTDLTKAQNQLSYIREDQSFYNCIGEEEKAYVIRQEEEIKGLIKKVEGKK